MCMCLFLGLIANCLVTRHTNGREGGFLLTVIFYFQLEADSRSEDVVELPTVGAKVNDYVPTHEYY